MKGVWQTRIVPIVPATKHQRDLSILATKLDAPFSETHFRKPECAFSQSDTTASSPLPTRTCHPGCALRAEGGT